jgi:hypothetical protein
VKQVPFEGTSMVYSFDHPDEPSHHHIQYFEMLGSRGIYKDGWWAGSFNHLPWPASPPSLSPAKPENHPWELYNLDADFSQAHNLAAQYPEKVKEMAELFDSEARRNQVYPLEPKRLPQPVPSGDPLISFLYKEGVQRIPGASAPRLAGRAHRITAEVEVPANGAQGVILAQGGRMGGFSLFMKDGFVQYAVNAFGNNTGTIVSSARLTPGKASIVLEFKPDESHLQRDPGQTRSIGPGIAKLSINGISAGESAISSFTGGGGETFDVGADLGSPVSSQYVSPFAFTGKIDFVKVDLE